MNRTFVVTGTDTNVGKTIFCAALVGALRGYYWKPIQCGNLQDTDSTIVARLSNIPQANILPESYRLSGAFSPHRSAELDGIVIDPPSLKPPSVDGPLLIEGAGGLMVPLTRSFLQLDLFAQWKLPLILVARTSLGTINHTLLSLSALRIQSVPLLGVVFVGEENPDTQNIICKIGQARYLGRLPLLSKLNSESLFSSFSSSFSLKDYT